MKMFVSTSVDFWHLSFLKAGKDQEILEKEWGAVVPMLPNKEN